MAGSAHAKGFALDKILVTGYGIDVQAVQHAVEPTTRGEYDCIFLGRFHAQKGLDDLIAVWRALCSKKPGSRLGVIGEGSGPAAARFLSEISTFGASVRLLGVLQGEDKYKALAKGRVFLFPSHHESWGHVVIEAMAAGLPVVGYDLDSSKEAFGSALLTVPIGDITAFSDAVARLLTDSDLHRKYQAAGWALAKRYDWDVIAKVLENRIWD
jgi:glycosyltransferase involved in cell wall biosynthesis